MEVGHEKDIPGIAGPSVNSSFIKDNYTELSFAVATSLAAVKRITWEQTPWLNPKLDAHLCTQMADYVSISTGQNVSPEAIHSALLFGETYAKDAHDRDYATYPQLLVVFPRRQHDISRDYEFLKVWHEEIMRPAFDRAWEESGLVKVYGASTSFFSRITNRFGPGLFHDKMANPVDGLLEHLRNGSRRRVHTHWPEWHDFWGDGHEGQFSDTRATVFDDAWTSIKGMLTGHPGMELFQDPVLLLVGRGRVDFNSNASRQFMFNVVGERWDKYVDSRFVVRNSFKVVIENIVGGPRSTEEQSEDAMSEESEDVVRDHSKRRASEKVIEERAGEPATKRARIAWISERNLD